MLLLNEDGKQTDSSNQKKLRLVAERLKNKGVHIIALSIDGNANKNVLSTIVSSPDNIFQKSLVNLDEAIKPLAKSLCLGSVPVFFNFFLKYNVLQMPHQTLFSTTVMQPVQRDPVIILTSFGRG